MTAVVDPVRSFLELEKRLEREPATSQGEIARGVYITSPTTERFDRREKMGAWGAMGVGWVWLVDVDGRRVETFANVRGSMVPGAVPAADAELAAEPFGALGIAVARLFPG